MSQSQQYGSGKLAYSVLVSSNSFSSGCFVPDNIRETPAHIFGFQRSRFRCQTCVLSKRSGISVPAWFAPVAVIISIVQAGVFRYTSLCVQQAVGARRFAPGTPAAPHNQSLHAEHYNLVEVYKLGA